MRGGRREKGIGGARGRGKGMGGEKGRRDKGKEKERMGEREGRRW